MFPHLFALWIGSQSQPCLPGTWQSGALATTPGSYLVTSGKSFPSFWGPQDPALLCEVALASVFAGPSGWLPVCCQDPSLGCERDRLTTHLGLQTPGMGMVAEGAVTEAPKTFLSGAAWEPPPPGFSSSPQEAVSTCCGTLRLP